MKRRLAFQVATVLGSGLLPKMPGTYGSIAALPFCVLLLVLCKTAAASWQFENALYALFVLLAYKAGVWSIPHALPDLPKRDAAKAFDHGSIVVDELLGMLIACWPILWVEFDLGQLCVGLVLAFGFFRLFDITKLWPINMIDDQDNARGVMLDDALAGGLAALELITLHQGRHIDATILAFVAVVWYVVRKMCR